MNKFVGVNEYSAKVWKLLYKGCWKEHKRISKELEKLRNKLKKEDEKFNKQKNKNRRSKKTGVV